MLRNCSAKCSDNDQVCSEMAQQHAQTSAQTMIKYAQKWLSNMLRPWSDMLRNCSANCSDIDNDQICSETCSNNDQIAQKWISNVLSQ